VGSITRSQEQERLRISHELHDETAQNLLAISRSLELQMAEQGGRGRLERIKALVDETLNGVRSMSRDLRPLALDDLGLAPALRALAEGAVDIEGKAHPEVHLKIRGSPAALSSEQELVLYRITQEALNNARKHAGAKNVWIELSCDPQSIELHISDDGEGFTVPESMAELAQQGSYGLLGIQERVWAIGGGVEIRSSPGGGTSIRIILPVNGGPASRPANR
jgi:signal transduction histidine kinase